MKREDHPTLGTFSSDARGPVLTREMLDRAIESLTDPERLKRQAEHSARVADELNLRAKTYWAKLHNKTVEELTSKDMKAMNDALFRAWLKYKGITKQDFADFYGF